MNSTDTTPVVRGLSSAEAAERRRRGEANTAVTGATRSYASILRTNVLSFFNIILSSSAWRCWRSAATAMR